MLKYGFIGTGNMGSALLKAVCASVGPNNVAVFDKNEDKAKEVANSLGCAFCDTDKIASEAQFIYLGVKPQVIRSVLGEIAPTLRTRKDKFTLVTMAAGVKIEAIYEALGFVCSVIRIMPNTPVAEGEGMILYSVGEKVSTEKENEFCKGLEKAGRLSKLNEALIDAGTAVSGCGPAFVYMFCEAMADAGVECGLTREQAIIYAAQTISGAAKLMLTTGKHPGVLKDEVCSPGGSTICGVHSLENSGFRGAVINAVKASFDKTKGLGK